MFFLVDGHELVRAGIEILSNNVENITVIGVAKSGEEALTAVASLCRQILY